MSNNSFSRVQERAAQLAIVYRASRNVQKSFNETQKNILELQKALFGYSCVLGKQATTYTAEEDAEGIVHDTETAAHFASYAGESLGRLSMMLNSVVTGVEKNAKKLAINVKCANPNMDLSVIGDTVIDESIGFKELEKNCGRNAIETFVDLQDTINKCMARMKDISKSLAVHRNDAQLALGISVEDPFSKQMENAVKSLGQDCITLDGKLKEMEDVSGRIMRLPDLGKNDNVKQDLVKALKCATDAKDFGQIRKFISELKKCDTIGKICSCISAFIDSGTDADELQSFLSFEDMINVIQEYTDDGLPVDGKNPLATVIVPPSGASAPSSRMRRGTLRLKALENALLACLGANETVLEHLAKAKQIPELAAELHDSYGSPIEPLLEAPSKFIHRLMELLSNLRISARNPDTGIDESDVAVVEGAFMQFVMLYDRQAQLYAEMREVKRVCAAYNLPASVACLGRKYLFSCSSLYLGRMIMFVSRNNVKHDEEKPGHLLSGKEVKIDMHVFSDIIVFCTKDNTEIWNMADVKKATKTKSDVGKRESKMVFAIKHYDDYMKGDKKVTGDWYYYFKVRATRTMEDADLPTIVERLSLAIETHKSRNILTMTYPVLSSDPTLSCDEVPRQFLHAIAWILANDMKAEGPFRITGSEVEKKAEKVMLANGYFPLYSPYLPEFLLKDWLKGIPGAIIDFNSADWEIKNKNNLRYELSQHLNHLLKPAQLKLFAIMVATAHCIIRHSDKTRFKKAGEIAPVFAPNLFLCSDSDFCFLADPMINVFTQVLNETNTPEKFREMFFSVFRGATEPADLTKPAPSAAEPNVRAGAAPAAAAQKQRNAAPAAANRPPQFRPLPQVPFGVNRVNARQSLMRSSVHHQATRTPVPMVRVTPVVMPKKNLSANTIVRVIKPEDPQQKKVLDDDEVGSDEEI